MSMVNLAQGAGGYGYGYHNAVSYPGASVPYGMGQ